MWIFRKEMGAFTTVQNEAYLEENYLLESEQDYNELLNNKNQYLTNLDKNTF